MKLIPVLLLLFVSFSASANLAPMLKPFSPTSTTVTNVGGSFTNVGANFYGRNAANSGVYGFRNVAIPKAGVLDVIKRRAGSAFMSPWLLAALFAADWFFDNGDIFPNGAVNPPASHAGCTVIQSGSGMTDGHADRGGFEGVCSASGGAIYQMTGIAICATPDAQVDAWGTPLIQYQIGFSLTKDDSGAYYPSLASCGDVNFIPVWDDPAPVPVSDTDLYNFAQNDFTPTQWRDIWKNPSTQRHDDVQPLTDAGTDMTNDYNADNDGDSNTNPTVDPDAGDTGSDSVDDVPPEEDPELLCDKFPDIIACQELDEVVPDPIPTVPEEEIASSFASENLSSNSSCPSPGSASIQGQSIAFSYQPLCDLATSIAPLFIALCSVIGLYILAGGIRD